MVQAALDRVSRNRTTITIAHRLATVKKADNIIVMRKGKLVQQGTHEELMADEGGTYWTLATAQQLTMSPDVEDKGVPFFSEVSEKPSLDALTTEDGHETREDTTTTASHDDAKRTRGFAGSFGLLLREQRNHWVWYLVLLVGAVGGGGKSSARI